MIRQKLHIEDLDITIYCYYAVSCYHTEEIVGLLDHLGANDTILHQAYNNLDKCSLDTGLTYYNPDTKKGVMVIALTSSAQEFLNSFEHELTHLINYIALAEGMSPYAEPIAYLRGDVAMAIYPKIKHLMCDCCRGDRK